MTKYEEILEYHKDSVSKYRQDKHECQEFAKTFYRGLLDYLECDEDQVSLGVYESDAASGPERIFDWAYDNHMFLGSDGLWHLPLRVDLPPTGLVLWLHFRKSELENVGASDPPRPFVCFITDYWPVAESPKRLPTLLEIRTESLHILYEMFFGKLKDAVANILLNLKIHGPAQHFDLLDESS